MKLVKTGVTRLVFLVGDYAIKVPRTHFSCTTWGLRWQYHVSNLVRGWLANRSEWEQRHRVDVNPPIFHLAHLVAVYRRAERLWDPRDDRWHRDRQSRGYSDEEAKPSSWGRFEMKWLLIDYDRAWQEPRGWIGGLYYGHQERLARRWMAMEAAE